MATLTSDASVGDNDSAASGTFNSSSPRRSLGEMLDARAAADAVGASGGGEDDVFSDMPSLSSYRADDLSQVTSTSHTSIASYSRGGDSRNEDDGDGDASLPSLSSIKPDDFSTCSSFHSQTPANHSSDHSGEDFWGSVASGNVSAETDSDEDAALSADRGPKKPSRGQKPRSKGSSRDESKSNTDSNLVNNAAPPRRASPPDDSDVNPSIKRPTRRLSPSSMKQQMPPIPPSIISHESPEFSTPGGFDVRVPVRRTASASSMQRNPVARTGSFPLSQLKRPSQTDNAAPNADGSSSSLRGGDSLPRLPRRTSTVEVEMGAEVPRALAAPVRYSDEGSRISDDTSRISEVNSRISDDVSLNSDLESDISIDTDDENEDVPPSKLPPVQPIHSSSTTNQDDNNHSYKDQPPPPPVESVEANMHPPVPRTITPTLTEEPEELPVSPTEPPTPAPDPTPVEPDPVAAVPEEAEVVVTEKENETIPSSSTDKPEEEDTTKKGKTKTNGVSHAEESGTSATDTDDTDGGGLKNGIKGKTATPSTRAEPSRGNLRKTISNSVKNSFRVVKRGVSKSASKLGSFLRKPES